MNRAIETPDKANAIFFAGMQLPVRDDDPDYPALVLGNYMLGGGFLNSRLAVRVRQKEGLSYGVGSQFNASSLDKVGNFMVYAIYAPQNLGKLEAAIDEEVRRAISTGFTDRGNCRSEIRLAAGTASQPRAGQRTGAQALRLSIPESQAGLG